MKKLFALTFLIQQICYASQQEKNIMQWKNITTKLIQKEHYDEVLSHYKEQQLEKHLISHFGQDNVQDLVHAVHDLPEQEFKQAENIASQACDNFNKSQNFPKVTPQGINIVEYIILLKNIQD